MISAKEVRREGLVRYDERWNRFDLLNPVKEKVLLKTAFFALGGYLSEKVAFLVIIISYAGWKQRFCLLPEKRPQPSKCAKGRADLLKNFLWKHNRDILEISLYISGLVEVRVSGRFVYLAISRIY